MCEKHKLVVRFANTDGDILRDTKDLVSDAVMNLKLGSCVYTESGLVIVDRTPTDETTRLWVRDIVNVIKYTRRIGLHRNAAEDGPNYDIECECKKTDEEEVIVYLPRMSGNMIEEAEHQRLFYSISKNTTLVAV